MKFLGANGLQGTRFPDSVIPIDVKLKDQEAISYHRFEGIDAHTISEWKKKRLKFQKKPAIFIFHKR